jgi:hypothetical protein
MTNSYEDSLKAHLAAYKRAALGAAEEGGWASAGQPYPYIVPADKRHLNLLAGYRAGIVGWLARRQDLRLHRDFHHLNSSQAMGFNLFWPAVASPAGRAALAQALGTAPIMATSPLFESEPDPVERTHFDLHLHTQDGGQLFFELKLSERQFGNTRADAVHIARLGDVYLERLQARVPPALLAPAAFAARYQLLRGLSHLATDADRLFLVMPRGNVTLHAQAEAFRRELPADAQAQVTVLDIETLVERLRRAAPADDPAWLPHYAEFLRKYVADAPLAA